MRLGVGSTIVAAGDGTPVGVVNVMGSLSLQPARTMWEVVDELVDEARATTPVVLVDVHAEATSEKVALARWLDGRVTAVIGTHTHVQTADARVQPGGTATITDAGMTGPHDSVIGVKAELATHRMRTGMPVRFEVATGGVRIEGVLVACDAASGRRDCNQPGSDPLAVGATRMIKTTNTPTSSTSRASTSHDAVGSNCFTRSQ